MKKKNLIILSVAIILILVLLIRNYKANYEYYQFEKVLIKDFPVIKTTDLSNYGPHCTIDIYLEEDTSFSDIEDMFEAVLYKLHDDKFLKYLRRKHCNNEEGTLSKMHVCIRYTFDEDKVIYKFSSIGKGINEDSLKLWWLEQNHASKDNVKYYNLLDYR